ncbi:hypothetical protein ACFW04_012283 [Cataglyphis niger]
MHAGCYIELPREIIVKRAVINVQSNDNACAVVAALYPAARNVSRESLYPHYTTVLNLQDIEFPVTVNQIKKFELANDISINKRTLSRFDCVLKRDKHVNLFYLQDLRDDNVGHFAWIKNLSRLVSSQLSKHNSQKYICDRCLHFFESDNKLQSHTIDGRKMNECVIQLPSENDKWLSFGNYNRKERLPSITYADLECVLKKTNSDPTTSMYTVQHHEIFSVGYYMQCSYDETLSAYYTLLLLSRRRLYRMVRRRTQKISAPCKKYNIHECLYDNSLTRTVGDISQRDALPHLQEIILAGRYTNTRSLSSDQAIPKSRAFKL